LQVLLLWDRVVSFDSLFVFAVAAAGILAWRAHMLRGCRNAQEVEASLQQLKGVRVVPLLQSILFLCGGSSPAAGLASDSGDAFYAL
jgi:hypothetical protein